MNRIFYALGILTIGLALIALLTLAVGCASGGGDTSDTHEPDIPTDTPAPTSTPVVGPIARSDLVTVFGEPLASGLSVADVVENALPSVVQISTTAGTGTGFIINETGLVVTNRHVVENARRLGLQNVGDPPRLRLVTGEEYEGLVTYLHPDLDLAYVQITSLDTFTPIAIGDSDNTRIGESIIVIGFPLSSTLGEEPTVSVGIVSARRDGYLQTDAAINPGNSGGPMLNMFGQAAGVITSRISEEGGRTVAGIGFAIPINAVKDQLGGQVSQEGKVLPTPTPLPHSHAHARRGGHQDGDRGHRCTPPGGGARHQDGHRSRAGGRAVRGGAGGHPHSFNTYCHAHGDTHGYTHSDANAAPYGNADSDTDSHAYPYAGAYGNAAAAHGYSHPQSRDLLPGVGGNGAGVDKAG